MVQNVRMATLFMVCGLPGSGKSSVARQLEQKHRAEDPYPCPWFQLGRKVVVD